jgi:hypothetical protein
MSVDFVTLLSCLCLGRELGRDAFYLPISPYVKEGSKFLAIHAVDHVVTTSGQNRTFGINISKKSNEGKLCSNFNSYCTKTIELRHSNSKLYPCLTLKCGMERRHISTHS